MGRPNDQIIHVPCRVRDIVGDASGTVGHIFGLFENSDLRIRLVPFDPACRAHAGRIATYDDELHKKPPRKDFILKKRKGE